MTTNLSQFKKELEKLIALGKAMQLDLRFRSMAKAGKLDADRGKIANKIKGQFESEYQRWYTEGLSLIKQLIPRRYLEFQQLYNGDGKRKLIDGNTYHVQDWLNGVRAGEEYDGSKIFNDSAIVSMKFGTQLAILESAQSRFESTLFDIKQLVQADLFDSELESARELLKHGYFRAAGAVAGVVLEKHLRQVMENHSITTRKKHPTISVFNDLLKKHEVLRVPEWRQIQRLGDLRNLCDHNKDKEPSESDIVDLIDGVEKLTKTLF